MDINIDFLEFYEHKKALERPFKVNFEDPLKFFLKTDNDVLSNYMGFSNEETIRDDFSIINFNKSEYTIDIPKGVYHFTLYPQYDEENLLTTLKKHGLTLNKVGKTPYLLLGNPNNAPTIIIANASGKDFLSSFILNGFIDSIVSNSLSNMENCFLIFPNIEGLKLDIASIIEQYKFESSDSKDIRKSKLIEISGNFKHHSNIIYLHNHPSNSFKDIDITLSMLKANEVSKARQDLFENIESKIESYIHIDAAYRLLEPTQAEDYGKDLALSILS